MKLMYLFLTKHQNNINITLESFQTKLINFSSIDFQIPNFHLDKVTQEESLNQSMNQSEQLCVVKRFKRVTGMKLLFQLTLYFFNESFERMIQ